MAQYEAWPGNNLSSCVSITSYEQADNITVYLVLVKIADYSWVVRHRYSDFFDLNEKLVTASGIDGSLLPPKKLFGKHSEAFLQRRRTELEQYLRTMLCLPTLPPALSTFLEFHKYEIHGITQMLAEDLFLRGDQLLMSREFFHVTPLQIHALAERLKLPEPTCDAGDGRKDIGHILDFFSQVKRLLVCGSNKVVGTSNIITNQLAAEFTSLKSVDILKLDGCNPRMLQGFDCLRKSVKTLHVQECLTSLRELLLCDTLHWDPELPQVTSVWTSAVHADFSYNQLTDIDQSIWLLPNLETLDLSHNQISSIDNLDRLSRLTHLNLSKNCLSLLFPLHIRLGNIVSLNVAGNAVESLLAFSKLYSLVSLDLLNNNISKVAEVAYISGLPCLEHLTLAGNPLASMVDYRTRILEQFNHRAAELCLDQERPSQQELDTVAVLQAIRRAREGTPQRRLSMTKNSHGRRIRSIHNVLNSDASAAPQVPQAQPVVEFRHQVEAIRTQGGEGWLRLWNHHQQQGGLTTSAANPVTNKASEHHIYQTDCWKSNNEAGNQKRPELHPNKDFILPNWFPDPCNNEVVETFDALKILPKDQRLGYFWSLVLCFPQRLKRITFPAYIAVAPGVIAIVSLKSIQCSDRYPQLAPYTKIDVDSLSNLVVGQHEHFVSFEARNADNIHAYTLLFSSRRINAYFVTLIQTASIHAAKHSLRIFQQEAILDGRLHEPSSFSWVAVDVPFLSRPDAVTCIIVRDTSIQLVYEQVVRLTNDKNHAPPFQVVRTWDVQRDIVDCRISLDDIETCSSDNNAIILDILPDISKDLARTLRNAGYPVSLSFGDASVLLARFPSQENRDEFLTAFTRVRQLCDGEEK